MRHTYNIAQLEQLDASPWMTDRQRQILDLRYRHGWAIEDIAAELYISRRTVGRELAKIHKIIIA